MRRAMLILLMMTIPGVAVSAQRVTGFLNRSLSYEGVQYRYQVYLPADYGT